MAQIVGYWDDNVQFNEGPFVLCNPCGNGWRVEVQQDGSGTPILTQPEVYALMRRIGWPEGKSNDLNEAHRVCNRLNDMVRAGAIVRWRGTWNVATAK